LRWIAWIKCMFYDLINYLSINYTIHDTLKKASKLSIIIHRYPKEANFLHALANDG
jgi:hypothetical protein